MALSKKSKIWITIISIPVMLLLLAIIGLKLYLTGDRLKALVIPRIEQATHRTVTVKEISFSIFPSFAVSIDDLAISNPEGMKFDKDSFLSLDNLRLKVNILALIDNKLEIKYVILDHPVIYMEAREDGVKNYSMTEKSSSEEGNLKVEKESSGALLLSNLEITNGELEFVNKKSNSRTLIVGYHQLSSVESMYGKRTLDISGAVSIDKLSYGTTSTWFMMDQPLKGNLKLTYDIDNDVLKFDEINASLHDLALTMKGEASKLTKDEMFFDFTINSPNAQMSQLLSIVPPDLLKKTAGMESSGKVTFSVDVKGALSDTKTPGAIGKFKVANGAIKYSALPKSITGININGSFEKPEAVEGIKNVGEFGLDKFEAMLGTNRISGMMSVRDFDDPSLNTAFNGSINLAEVKEFYPLDSGTELVGTLNGNVTIAGKVKLPQSIQANGKIEFQNVTMKTAGSPKPLSNLMGTVSFNNQLIESKQLSMNIGESDLTLGFVMKNYLAMVMDEAKKSGGKPSASITLTSKQLRTVDLISETNPDTTHTGNKQNAETKAMFLPGIDVDANVSIGKLTTEKFEFTNARGSISVVNGIINLKNFSVNAFQGTVLTKGMLDLRDMKKRPFDLDLDIVGVEANTALSKFTSFGKNIFGKFTMNTKLKGDLNDTLGLNTKTLSGDGKVQIFDGKLHGFPLTNRLAEFTGVNELREVNFKNWSNAFSISDGKLNIKDLKINAGSTDFLLNGSHGLDGMMAYNLNVKLPGSLSDKLKLSGVASELIKFFKDKDGRINLDFDVSGETTSPALKLNTKAQEEIAKQTFDKEKQKLLDEGKKKIGDELKKKAEEGLKKLFKKP